MLVLLEPVSEWTGYSKYNFIGGHHAADSIPANQLKRNRRWY